MFSAWSFGITSVCPSQTGKMSRKATACSSSATREAGAWPATMAQKMQPSWVRTPGGLEQRRLHAGVDQRLVGVVDVQVHAADEAGHPAVQEDERLGHLLG